MALLQKIDSLDHQQAACGTQAGSKKDAHPPAEIPAKTINERAERAPTKAELEWLALPLVKQFSEG